MKKILLFLSRTDLFFYSLFWLIFLLIAGTVAQKNLGLYVAQQKYFSSFILWIDFIPLPAGYSIMSFMFISLTAKLALEKWAIKNLGIIIIHLGALCLFIGGFITAKFSYEANMVLAQGETKNYMHDYYQYELVFTNVSNPNYNEITAFSENSLQQNSQLKSANLNFDIKIKEFYKNANIIKRDEAASNQKLAALAQIYNIIPLNLVTPYEKNRGAAILNIQDKIYYVFAHSPIEQYIVIDNITYKIELRHQRSFLPFKIELISFSKEFYPASDKVKNYSSIVKIHDNNLSWQGIITMNKPLRYKGYSIFQASFIDNPHKDITVLAIVENMGRIFPYLASIIMCIGLLINLYQRFFIRKRT